MNARVRKAVRLFGAMAAAVMFAGEGPAPVAPAQLTATITVLSLSSSRGISEKETKSLFDDYPFATPAGTNVTVLADLSSPLAGFSSAGVIDSVVDDQGRDLSKGATATVLGADSTYGSPLSIDRKALMLNLGMPQTPAAGTRKVTIKGHLKVLQEEGTETLTLPSVPLELATPIKAGSVIMRISDVIIESDGETYVAFHADKGDWVKNVELLDAKGNAMKSRYPLQRQWEQIGREAREQKLSISVDARLSDTVTLRVTVVKEAKSVDVPFEVTAGIGQ